jgi:hypothetical protein
MRTLDLKNIAFCAARKAAFSGGAGRLSRIKSLARVAGELAMPNWDCMDAVDDALWRDGQYHIDRPSRQVTWSRVQNAAMEAYADGVRVATRRIADNVVRRHRGSIYAALYATAYHVAKCGGDDEEIVETVRAAMVVAGYPCEFGALSPMFPIRRARIAQADRDISELVSLSLPSEPMQLAVIVDSEELAAGLSQVSPEDEAPVSSPPACPPRVYPVDLPPNGSALSYASCIPATPPPLFSLETEPGLLGDIARWSQVHAFRPVREFAQPAAVAALSALIARRWATPSGLGLNLYLIGIAETGGGKDALLSAPRALLSAAGFDHLLGPGDFSSDAAIENSLRARPAQLMPLDEFGKLAQAMIGRTAPSWSKLAAKALLEIYPRSQVGSAWTGKARASDEHDCASEPVFSPTLSILGVSTPQGFFDGMNQESLDDGFLNRLTVVRAGQAGARQRDAARLLPPSELIEALRAAVEASTPGNIGGVSVRDARARPNLQIAAWEDDTALSALEEVEAWEDEARDAGRNGVAGRAAEQTQKIATLRALARNTSAPRVSSEDIQWAFEMVRTSIENIETGVRDLMAGSEFEKLVNAVEKAVIRTGERGLAWSHLVKSAGVSKADPRLLEQAVKRLEEGERIWRLGAGGKRLKVRREDERE